MIEDTKYADGHTIGYILAQLKKDVRKLNCNISKKKHINQQIEAIIKSSGEEVYYTSIPNEECFCFPIPFGNIEFVFKILIHPMWVASHEQNLSTYAVSVKELAEHPLLIRDTEAPTLSLNDDTLYYPICILRFQGKMRVVDGNKRLATHIKYNMEKIPCVFFPVDVASQCMVDPLQQRLLKICHSMYT